MCNPSPNPEDKGVKIHKIGFLRIFTPFLLEQPIEVLCISPNATHQSGTDAGQRYSQEEEEARRRAKVKERCP